MLNFRDWKHKAWTEAWPLLQVSVSQDLSVLCAPFHRGMSFLKKEMVSKPMPNVSFEHKESLGSYFCGANNFSIHRIILQALEKQGVETVTDCGLQPLLVWEEYSLKAAWAWSANCHHSTHHPFQEQRCWESDFSGKSPKLSINFQHQNQGLCFVLCRACAQSRMFQEGFMVCH